VAIPCSPLTPNLSEPHHILSLSGISVIMNPELEGALSLFVFAAKGDAYKRP